MIYKKEEYLREIISEIKDSGVPSGISEDQLYSILNKYIYVPPRKLSDPEAALSILNVSDSSGIGIGRFSNVFFNFKDCIADLLSIPIDIKDIVDDSNPILLKFAIVMKIIITIVELTSVKWDNNEFYVIYELYKMNKGKEYVEINNVVDNIIKKHENTKKEELQTAIDTLYKLKCLNIENDKIKLNEVIVIR